MIGKQAYINALTDSIPEIVTNKDLAEQIVDVLFSVPIRALENGDDAEIPGLGVVKINKSKGKDCLSYEPIPALIECVLK